MKIQLRMTGADREQLSSAGRVLIREIIDPEVANEIRDCLKKTVSWSLAYQDGQGAIALDAEQYSALSEQAYHELQDEVTKRGQSAYSFMYDSYMMIPAYLQRRNPGLLLNQITEAVNSPPLIQSIRDFTGDQSIGRTIIQATRYRQGHFLTRHNDRHDGEDRRFAFVLGLTTDWQADFGGLTHFYDDDHQWQESLLPGFNQMLIFRVPVWHSVGMVTRLATQHRYSLTGWFSGVSHA